MGQMEYQEYELPEKQELWPSFLSSSFFPFFLSSLPLHTIYKVVLHP
jgi:hypothetical protein